MQRWISRAVQALLISVTLPAAVSAQPPAPANPPVPAPAAAPHPAPPPAGVTVVVPNGTVYVDPYHAATPYNPAVVNQAVPAPALDRPVTTLPCDIPNQNLDPFVPTKPGCGKWGWFKKGGCGCGKPCAVPDTTWGKITHPYCGVCSKGGSATTGCNTANFILASSRSYFGESSREFFERPPSQDGIKMKPKAYYPPPAPGAFIPQNAVVDYVQAPPKQTVGVFPPVVAGKVAE